MVDALLASTLLLLPQGQFHVAPPVPVPLRESVWDRLAECESDGRWDLNVGAYDGGLQHHPQTWTAYKPEGFPQYAWQASRAQQIQVAEAVLAEQGWQAWPACARRLGLS